MMIMIVLPATAVAELFVLTRLALPATSTKSGRSVGAMGDALG
jgi:hypothetical protein